MGTGTITPACRSVYEYLSVKGTVFWATAFSTLSWTDAKSCAEKVFHSRTKQSRKASPYELHLFDATGARHLVTLVRASFHGPPYFQSVDVASRER